MNYEALCGKSILLLGKTRSLNPREFEKLLKLHGISCAKEYSPDVAYVAEGRMMNPYEQGEAARIYEAEAAPIGSVDPLEEWLCRSIEPNRLLMSLKLSKDQERLVDFLQNPYITDEVFYKLLKLYDWQGEGLFDNDRNRDVTAAIIGRFYTALERNHNVQYAMSGLAHLVEHDGTEELIGAVAELAPIANELKNPSDRSLSGVLDAMALHPKTPERVLRQLLRTRAALLARREPLGLEKELLEDGSVDRVLAQNPTLSQEGAAGLMERHPDIIARHFPVTPAQFESLIGEFSCELAANPHLEPAMQEALMAMQNDGVYAALASNHAVAADHLRQLLQTGRFDAPLASNENLSSEELGALYRKGNPAVLEALAHNPSTPIELLYQLSLDRRFERAVKTNPSFGRHIQTHNIGWY